MNSKRTSVSSLAALFAAAWLCGALVAPAAAQQPADERAVGTAKSSDAKPDDAKPSGESKRVKVTAEGINKDDALKRALRKALEQGAGAQIASFSNVKNYELIKDTIYSRSFGVVTDYKILNEDKGAGGTVILTIEAVVRADAVAKTWGEVQNVLDQIGRPKIMVWIDEKIDSELQSDSIVATRIEEMFVKAGFDLVNRQAVEDLAKREHADALREGNLAKIAALAKDAGAQIMIRGTANANRAGIRDLYGVAAASYNCDVMARMYYTDTARLLASESLPQTSALVRSHKEFSPQAARLALVNATFPDSNATPPGSPTPLAVRIYEAVMEQWSTLITAGGDIDLEIEELDIKSYLAIKKALQDVDGVKSVDGDFTKGIAKLRLKTTISAENLTEKLTGEPFSQWMEIVDLKVTRIQAKGVKKSP